DCTDSTGGDKGNGLAWKGMGKPQRPAAWIDRSATIAYNAEAGVRPTGLSRRHNKEPQGCRMIGRGASLASCAGSSGGRAGARVVRRVRCWPGGRGGAVVNDNDPGPVESFNRLGPDGLPLPPGRLRNLVAGPDEADWFLEGGRLAAASMQAILARQGIAIDRL